jgi:hypothetical protein
MPDIHDGCELFPETPPQGDLSVCPGSQTKPVLILPQIAPQISLTICPRLGPESRPDVLLRNELRHAPSSSTGLQLATDTRREASSSAPHRPNWTLLARSVWQANRRTLEEVPPPQDTPAWLRSSPAFSHVSAH